MISPRTVRLARLVVLAISLGFGIAYVVVRSPEYEPADVTAYWDAAIRLRTGEPLYVSFPDPEAPEVFRYAPWFAIAWIPLTFLPKEPVLVAWWLLMIGMAVYLLYRIARLGYAGLGLVGIIGPFLIWIAGRGNAHPLVLLPLVLGVESRAGPWIVGLTASLKATPLAFALVYLGRREFGKFAIATGIFVLLVAPILLFGIEGFQSDPGLYPNPIFAASQPAWAAVVVGLSIATLIVAYRWPRYAWILASFVATAAVIRFLPYNLSYLLVGTVPAVVALGSRASGSTSRAL